MIKRTTTFLLIALLSMGTQLIASDTKINCYNSDISCNNLHLDLRDCDICLCKNVTIQESLKISSKEGEFKAHISKYADKSADLVIQLPITCVSKSLCGPCVPQSRVLNICLPKKYNVNSKYATVPFKNDGFALLFVDSRFILKTKSANIVIHVLDNNINHLEIKQYVENEHMPIISKLDSIIIKDNALNALSYSKITIAGIELIFVKN